MGKMQRIKGAAFEREVANLLNDHLHTSLSRNLVQYQESSGRDLVDDSFPFCIQCQHAERIDIYGKLAEAAGAARPGEMPVAIVKRNRGSILTIMRLMDWIGIVYDALRFRKIMIGVQTAIVEEYKGRRARPVAFVENLAVMRVEDFKDWFGDD